MQKPQLSQENCSHSFVSNLTREWIHMKSSLIETSVVLQPSSQSHLQKKRSALNICFTSWSHKQQQHIEAECKHWTEVSTKGLDAQVHPSLYSEPYEKSFFKHIN